MYEKQIPSNSAIKCIAIEVARIDQALAAMPTVMVNYDNLRIKEAEVVEHNAKLRDLIRAIRAKETALIASNNYIEEAEDYNREIVALKNTVRLLDMLSKYLKESRVKFLSAVWRDVTETASTTISGSTGIEAILKSDKHGFEYEEGGRISPCTAASGAQRGFMGVAIRLSMSRVLKIGMPTMILDEPTESMSEGNAEVLAGSLLGNSQVLLITHRKSESLMGANLIEIGHG